jgi:hypothetical protein
VGCSLGHKRLEPHELHISTTVFAFNGEHHHEENVREFRLLVTPHIGEIFQVLVQFFPPLTAITANLNNAKGVDAVSLSFFSGVRRMSIAPYLVSFL